MKFFKIGLLTLLAIAFYAEGIMRENTILIWSGHTSVLFAAIYGYIKLVSVRRLQLTSGGRIAYGLFDVIITFGMFYYLFHISYFSKYSAVESFLLITAITFIIIGKSIYYSRKELFTGNLTEV